MSARARHGMLMGVAVILSTISPDPSQQARTLKLAQRVMHGAP